MHYNFIIVAQFYLPHEMEIAKLLLESNDIECITKDKLTIQSYHFISNAIGGVKLLVSENDFNKARELLIKQQIITESTLPSQDSTEVKLANTLNAILTFINKLNISIKFLLLVLVLIIYCYLK